MANPRSRVSAFALLNQHCRELGYERAQQPMQVRLSKQAKIRARRAKILQAIREKQ